MLPLALCLRHTGVVTPKVVILSAFLRPFRSGAEACTEEVAARLKGRYEIVIVTARLSTNLLRRDVIDGVTVVRVGFGSRFDKWLFPFLAPLAARQQRPAVIHAILESYAGLAMIFCKILLPGVPRLLTCQSTNTTLLVSLMHSVASRVTVISSVLRERAAAMGRGDAVLIPNGIPRAALQAAGSRFPKVPGRMLFVGRLEPMKGVDTLLEAFARVQGILPEWQLRIAGDGSERPRLEKLTRALDLAGRVTFLGRLSHDAVLKEFAEAEIFCGLSRSEALGNVFLEAQAAGTAVLATRVGGIPDVVSDSETGLLIPVDDVPAAAKALEQLGHDAALRQRLGENGRAAAAAYDWDGIAERYAEQYDLLIKKP